MTLSKAKLELYRKQLTTRRDELLKEVENSTASFIDDELIHADSIDQAAADTDRGIEVSIKNRERDLIREIEDALRRIDNGAFGDCESCGEEIGEARIKASPSTTLCIDCKAELESEFGRFPRRA